MLISIIALAINIVFLLSPVQLIVKSAIQIANYPARAEH